MRHKNLPFVGQTRKKSSLILISNIAFVISIIIMSGFSRTFSNASEPDITDNLDGTITANWPLDNSSDYNLFNLTMDNGAVNLTLNSYWWNQSEFDSTDMYNINMTSYPDELELESKVGGVGKNLIKNGDFKTPDNWSLDSSDNITSVWDGSWEYGKIYHYSPSNPIYQGEQNVSNASGDGTLEGGASTIEECLQYKGDGSYYRTDQGQNITITNFYIGTRYGTISEVWLHGIYFVESAYTGNESLMYKNESGIFQNSSIHPSIDYDEWITQSHNITDAFSFWTWNDIENLEVSYINDDTKGFSYVDWDRIWLNVTIERFDQTAYINQTFEVLNTTGFNDSYYEDFSKSMENNSVNFTSVQDSVVLDYASSFLTGQITLYANDTGGNGSFIVGASGQDDNNYGASKVLWIGWTTIMRTLLRFNISNIPQGAIITNATMELYAESLTNDIPVAVYKLTTDWDEGIQEGGDATDGVTWLQADTSPPKNWGTNGGDFPDTVYNVSTVGTIGNHSFNITTLVQEWVNSTPNYGLLLKDLVDGSGRSVEFSSDDSDNLSHRPRLIVNWKLPNYHTYGNFTSQVFNAETTVNNWGNISWNCNLPQNTTIKFQTRNGTDPDPISNPQAWGTWSSYYTQSGEGITSGPGQYIQYRAHLETSRPNISPVLYDVTIIFSRTNLTFYRVVDACSNATEFEMSVAINDTVVWNPGMSQSPWAPETRDISEWILSKGTYNISLRMHLVIETENEVNCSVGFDNITIGTVANESRGQYISVVHDAGTMAIWKEINWNATLPQDTKVIIQSKTSSNNLTWEDWSATYSNPIGDSITSPNNRYIRYRVILITTNSSFTPMVSDVNISYQIYSKNGTLEMKNDLIASNVVDWGVFTINDNLVQWINFSYSTDSGNNWYSVPISGNMGSADTSSYMIRFRANFTAMDTSMTPTLFGFSLTYITNHKPEFISSGFINETGGLGGGWFNFSVLYLDQDNDLPSPIKLTITGDGNYNLTMNDLDVNDMNVSNGKWYFINLTFPKGSYQYRFIAYDGKIWNLTSYDGFLVNNNPPELQYPDVDPGTGSGGTSFNFTVTYRDNDNDPPFPINLTVLGPSSYNVTMMWFDLNDDNYKDGKEYYYNLILEKGSYTYFFTAFDNEIWGFTTPLPLEVTNNPPELVSLPVSPMTGNRTTTFNFTVNYIDLDNDSADNVFLNLSGPSNSGSYIMDEVDPGDADYTDGKLYYYEISNLTKGFYTHHFAANDSDRAWAETTEIFLPQVLNLEPWILTPDVDYIDEDSLYSVHYQYLDIDNDTCVWLLDTNASWLTLDSNTGYLNGTLDNGDVGQFWVNITVNDNDGGINWTFFMLTVNNTIPQITTTSPHQWAFEGYEYMFDFNGQDEMEGNAYWNLATNASWLDINTSNGVLFGIPGAFDVGSYWVNVTLYDGNGDFDSLNFSIIVNDTSAPMAVAGSDDTIYEDTPYPFDGSGSSDNSGVITNYTWYFGDGAVGYGPTPTHIYTNKGLYLVVLFVLDASGNEGFDSLEITVENLPPMANLGPDKIADEGEPVYFDASASNDTQSDNSSLLYMWDFDDDGEFDDGIGVLASFIWYDEGVYTIGLKVIDDNGDYGTDNLNVTVNNIPPMVNLGGPYSGFEGREIYFFATAMDEGNDVLWFRWDWNNDGVNDTGWSLNFYSNHIWAKFGTYTIGVEVWDEDGGYSSDTAFVNVIRPEQPPVISGVGGRYVHYDYPYLLDLTPYVFDPDTSIDDLIVTTSDPAQIDVNGLILTLTYPESMVGQTRVVIITVSDGKNKDNDTLTVSITANYPPEVSGDIPDVSFNEGEILQDEFNLDNYFTDKDNDPLSYHFIGNIHIRPELNSSTGFVSFSAEPNWYGIENITIRAYDPHGAFTEQLIKVTVNAVNFPPTIGGIQDVYVRLNSPWELLVLNPVYVWDDDSILDLTLFTDSWNVAPSPTKEGVLVFHYTDPFVTTESVQISVSDGEFTASTNVTVHISLINWPPYIKDFSYPSNIRFNEDAELEDYFNLNNYFADNTTDVLTFMQIVSSSDLFVTIDSQGSVSFSASENWFGLATVTFRATDNEFAWASFTVNVTVDPVNDVPVVVQTITYLQINEDETWIIDLDDYFSDVENGTTLTFSCNNPDIIIDPLTHEARWERNKKTTAKDVVFSASDGEDSVSMDPIDLGVVVKEEAPFNWLWVIIAAFIGAMVVLVYRGLRYRYKIEEAFLINNAGILLAHVSRGESRLSLDIELVSAMLTAVQEFVRDSFSGKEKDDGVILDRKKSLEKLEFGGFHLVLEDGKYSLLCVVISGYVNKGLRKRMRIVLDEFEQEYGETLEDWDGIVERFDGAKVILAKLIKKEEWGEEDVKPPLMGMEIEEFEEAQIISSGEESVTQSIESEENELR